MNPEEIYIPVTEKAAQACYECIGKNDSHQADQMAVEAMREAFRQAPIDGTVVIGEGERDQAPMLYIGEKVGKGEGYLAQDIAVDPLEGTGLCARGEEGALCVLVAAPFNHLLQAPDVYMNKLACKPQDLLKLKDPLEKKLNLLSDALNKPIEQLRVAVLDRKRHESLIKELKSFRVQLILFQDGDVLQSLLTTLSDAKDSIDLLLGSGGAPEGVLSAAALNSLGGDFQGQLLWANEEQKTRAKDMGIQNLNRIYTRLELALGDTFFCATAVTPNSLMKGIEVRDSRMYLETLVCSPQGYKIHKSQYPIRK